MLCYQTVNFRLSVLVFYEQFRQNFVNCVEQFILAFIDGNCVFFRSRRFVVVVKGDATEIGIIFSEIYCRHLVNYDGVDVLAVHQSLDGELRIIVLYAFRSRTGEFTDVVSVSVYFDIDVDVAGRVELGAYFLPASSLHNTYSLPSSAVSVVKSPCSKITY